MMLNNKFKYLCAEILTSILKNLKNEKSIINFSSSSFVD